MNTCCCQISTPSLAINAHDNALIEKDNCYMGILQLQLLYTWTAQSEH